MRGLVMSLRAMQGEGTVRHTRPCGTSVPRSLPTASAATTPRGASASRLPAFIAPPGAVPPPAKPGSWPQPALPVHRLPQGSRGRGPVGNGNCRANSTLSRLGNRATRACTSLPERNKTAFWKKNLTAACAGPPRAAGSFTRSSSGAEDAVLPPKHLLSLCPKASGAQREPPQPR